MQRIEECFNKRVRILTLQVVVALVPTPIFRDVWAPLRVVEEHVRGTSEVLLSVGVVALGPFVVLLVHQWAE